MALELCKYEKTFEYVERYINNVSIVYDNVLCS